MSDNNTSLDTAPERTRWQQFRLVVKVVELRLRFIALMALTGLVFAYWDTIWNKVDKWQRPASTKTVATSHTEYYCPMHPNVVRDEPGACPICGMPLSKRMKGENKPLPPGVIARVQLAPFRIQQAGIQTAEVVYAPLIETLTAVGYVEFDERRLAHIASKIRGMARVEKLHVNFTGVDVAEGQTLAELYSPELYQAIQELLIARKSADSPRMRSTLGQSILGDRRELSRLAEEKLKLWGLTQTQIDEILKQGKADYKVPIVAPIGGHVLKKNVVEGQYVQEGQAMFEIADLHTVWVKAQVFEDEAGLVDIGQSVEATVEALPGETFPGKVAFVQPHLDPVTRTMEVRYDLGNPGHKLRPGMYATVTLKTPVAETPMFRERLAALHPADASLRKTGLTVEEQKICPVTDAELGSMGDPVRVEVDGQKLWTCCDACPPKVKARPAQYLAKLAAVRPRTTTTALVPNICPVTGAKLGSMGAPVPVEVNGKTILTCCAACPPKLKADPARYLARLVAPPKDTVLTIPESAVIDTGTDKVVYVEAEPGVFEGRKVVLGTRSGDRYPVLDGLAAGERVAAAGAFLIDAESRINPATRGTTPPAKTPKPEKPAPPKHQHGSAARAAATSTHTRRIPS
ncbi:MAG: efflux RND transporter periplasmic adaptor subunit [Isosphaeraceae bacterium]|nr:efflux RND transporter periplasmic adaptor subunit [Isosphaeraceae bacterium]